MTRVRFLANNDNRLATIRCYAFRCLAVLACLAACRIPVATGQQPIAFSIRAQNFTTDNLQNIYVITPENEVVKFTPDGQEVFRYPNKTLGQVAFLDATNPFNLLLFLPEYQNVLMLDRTLNLIAQFNLFRFGLFQVNAVGMASDGHLWAYDETTFRLEKITSDGTVMVESGDLSLALGQTIQPNFLIEREQQVFLNDPNIGVLMFDVFGQYLKTIDIKGLSEFQIMDDQLIYCREGKLRSFHLSALLDRGLSTPVQLPQSCKVRLGKQKLFVLEADTLKVYPF